MRTDTTAHLILDTISAQGDFFIEKYDEPLGIWDK